MNPSISESVLDHGTAVEDRSRDLHHASPVVPVHVEPAGGTLSVIGRLVKMLFFAALLIGGGVFAMYKMHVNVPALNTPKVYAYLDTVGARAEHIKANISARYGSYFHKPEEEAHHEEHRIVVTSPLKKDVTIVQDYVCQIRSRKHIDICALESGYLEEIKVREGQTVKATDVLFKVVPVLYKARLDAEAAERDFTQLELNNTRRLADRQGVSQQEVKLFEAKLAKAQAKVDLAQAELNFASVRAPFDGIIDRLAEMQGSLVKEGDVLTTLSDNHVMWVYFNVTEKRYLEYMAETNFNQQSPDVELILANHTKFPQIGKIGAIEANFNPETGNIAFRADFANPNGLLRHGQTGKVLINRVMKDALVIPQRATFENLAKRYVYIVGKDDVVHQREIHIEHELDDIFVIDKDLSVDDHIILEGIRQVRDGEKVEGEFRKPEDVMKNQKNKAE